MGMPPQRRRERRDDQPRRHRVNLRLGDDEAAALAEAAAAEGLTPSSYAARVTVAAARGEAAHPIGGPGAELAELLAARAALSRIGANLNQIARALNSDAEVTAAHAEAVLDRVRAAIQRVDQATLVSMRRRRPR
ncbi:plasmid mobilization protein [Streptomyces albidoflavus]